MLLALSARDSASRDWAVSGFEADDLFDSLVVDSLVVDAVDAAGSPVLEFLIGIAVDHFFQLQLTMMTPS